MLIIGVTINDVFYPVGTKVEDLPQDTVQYLSDNGYIEETKPLVVDKETK